MQDVGNDMDIIFIWSVRCYDIFGLPLSVLELVISFRGGDDIHKLKIGTAYFS